MVTFTKVTSPSYDLYSVFDNQKALKNTLKATTFKVEENSRTSPKIQGLFKAVRTLSVL